MNAIIPARGGSKGIPRKNLLQIGGYPLIYYTISFCQSGLFDRVFVSSEDEEILRVAREYGAETIVRPKEYSSDDSSDWFFLNHYFEIYNKEEVALMRPTTPFRNSLFVKETKNIYEKNKERVTGLRSVSIVSENPYKLYKIEGSLCRTFFQEFNGIKDFSNLPRQAFPKCYRGNGHIDIVKRETIKAGSVFGSEIFAVEGEKLIDIDDWNDVVLAKKYIGERKL